MDQCSEVRRLEAMEEDIQELKVAMKENRTDISALKESAGETKIYVKQIFERIDDVKLLFNNSLNNLLQLITANNKANASTVKDVNSGWIKVVIELIKTLGIIAGIIAGIKISGGV